MYIEINIGQIGEKPRLIFSDTCHGSRVVDHAASLSLRLSSEMGYKSNGYDDLFKTRLRN
jgi:hypothetical protein